MRTLVRVAAVITLMMAVATLGVWSPEHLHDAALGEAPVVHRHLIDARPATTGPALRMADHSTVKLLADVFDVTPIASTLPALVPDRVVLATPDERSVDRLVAYATPPIHGPPPRLAPSRAPPRS